ncbi:hypothetical protein [Faecalibacterium sp. 9]|uniref:hypothetical protein n=1 Tax=Faecalibacterium sp. 9 TaxID=3402018 RepID=UPI003AABB3DD
MKDGEILGFDDYVKAFKENNPAPFCRTAAWRVFRIGDRHPPGQPANTHEAAKCCIRAAFSRKVQLYWLLMQSLAIRLRP